MTIPHDVLAAILFPLMVALWVGLSLAWAEFLWRWFND
jgi:hypothetical protein